MYWINGSNYYCYISEQRQWRKNLGLSDTIEWKQCAPSGLVSQRFGPISDAFDAFEEDCVIWSHDLHLRRMGQEMSLHRSADDYRPTYIRIAEANGKPVQSTPWINENGCNWKYQYLWDQDLSGLALRNSLVVNFLTSEVHCDIP